MQNENKIKQMKPENQWDWIVHNAPSRIDICVSKHIETLTRSAVQKLISEGCVLVNGEIVTKSVKVGEGDRIHVDIPKAKPLEILPEPIPLEILYEDPDLLVVNKPKGMVVHPAPGHSSKTLVNALLSHCKGSLSGINGYIRPGIVHRIDKDTSGLLIVAKNDFAHRHLSTQISEHTFMRVYYAVVYGGFKVDAGTIDKPLARHPTNRKRMAVVWDSKNSKPAVTHFQVERRFSGFTQIEARLETGRTHQIRVHMASIGHPLAGDSVYGPKHVIERLSGQCLHAAKIGFVHPRSNKYLSFDSKLPPYFQKFLSTLTEI